MMAACSSLGDTGALDWEIGRERALFSDILAYSRASIRQTCKLGVESEA